MSRPEDYLLPDGSVRVPPALARWIEIKARIDGAMRSRVKLAGHPVLHPFLLALHQSAMSASGTKSARGQGHHEELWMTTAEAAVELGKTDRCVRRWCEQGTLIARKHGRVWLVRRVDVETLRAAA
ncbi:helix-turn-helix domain-containing protein [Mycobacteroides abscessus]|uniref:helix-turn-helix domain-containing protein n=1 Tax=Mycobacteroides abscessus TaxID=36809 RepID=UPI000C26A76C|nr:helix-turn-helix domain-containing protein [Mycobacteroides abscessus]